MAVDLDIIPGSPQSLRWGRLKCMIHSVLSHTDGQIILPDVNLFDLSSKRAILENEELSCPGYYYFGFAQDTTLSLTLEPNAGGQEDIDYIDDFGRIALPEFKDSVRRIWESAGFLVTVTSGGGRAKGELQLMAHIASCIATLTKGYVVVTENGNFRQPMGIYSPDEFVSYESAL